MSPIPYTYTSLPLVSGDEWSLQSKMSQIRLLKLLPSEDFDSPISCVMRQETLSAEMDQTSFLARSRSKEGGDGLPKPPVYEALSYVWGDPDVTRGIAVSDEGRDDAETKGQVGQEGELQVTVNLYSALQYLRLKDRPRVLWVDAVCID